MAPTCDWKYDVNGVLASWLAADGRNHLIVLSAEASEEKVGGKPTYAGLWHFYFAGIWNKPFADRAVVCDYDDMGHTDVLVNFSYVVNSDITSCPSDSRLTRWNP